MGPPIAVACEVTTQVLTRYPLLLPLIFFGLGLYWGGREEPFSPLILGISSAVGALLAVYSRRTRALGIACLALGLGAWRVAMALSPAESGLWRGWMESSAKIEASWRVTGYAECERELCRFPAELLGYWEKENFRPLERGLLVKARGERFLVPGQVYRSLLKLRRPRGFRNPYSFDYPRYLRLSGVSATAFVEDLGALRLEGEAPWYFQAAGALRLRLRERIRASVPEGAAQGVLAALLLGEEGMLSEEIEEDFRRAGLTHVLVVSGLHFGLVLIFFCVPLYLLLSLRRPWAENGQARLWALGWALLPAGAYGLVVGLNPSVWRGLGFCAALFLAAALRRRRDFTSCLVLVAWLLLLLHPLWFFSLSFQLSFFSVAALVYFGRAFTHWWGGAAASRPWMKSKILRWGAATLYASFVANFALLPILTRAFHEVSLIAPLTNLILVPFFASVLLPAELFAGLVDFLHPAWSGILFKGLGRTIDPILAGLAMAARWRHATAWVGSWEYWHWLAYAALFVALAFFGRWRRFVVCLGLAAGFLLSAWGWAQLRIEPSRLSLTVLDVGQGESLLLRLPERQVLVLDGGGFPYSDFDVGKNVVIPELVGRGLRRPLALILSHPDADHWKGLQALAERLSVGEFWIGEGTLENESFQRLRSVLEEHEIPIRILHPGRPWILGGAEFQVLWPPAESSVWRGLSDNDRSLVLRVCYREVCFLLTGDLEAAGEAGIAAELATRKSQVLKVAHHGSGTSTGESFLKRVRPQWALISAGEGNRYRLPHATVVGRLLASGARVLRTDRMGQLEIETDGRDIYVRRFIDGPSPSYWSAIRAAAFGSGS